MAEQTYRCFIYDPGSDPTVDVPSDADRLGDRSLEELFERIEKDGGSREPRMPEICAGGHVGFDLLINVAGGGITSVLIWAGAKLHTYFKNKKGSSGDVNALKLVALFHLSERYPDVVADQSSCESLGEVVKEGEPAHPFSAVYLYRVRDLRSGRVFVLEVTSDGDLVTLTERGHIE